MNHLFSFRFPVFILFGYIGAWMSVGCQSPSSTPESTVPSSQIRWFTLDVNQWIPTHPDDDPLSSHRPHQDQCDDGWWIESGLIEVSTQVCKYFSMSYTSDSLSLVSPEPLEALFKRTLFIKGGIIHDALTYAHSDEDPNPKAHVSLVVNQLILWEKEISIPSLSNYLSFQLEIPPLLSEPIAHSLFTLHLHNHGANQWRWLPLKIGYKETPLQ